MELTESLNKYLFDRVRNLVEVVNIRKKSGTIYTVIYIYFTQKGTHPPIFYNESKDFDLISELRDNKIDDILSSTMTLDSFDVEEYLYTPDQKEKIEILRNHKQKEKDKWKSLSNAKKDYSETFKIGQRIWYKHQPGIITFKHSDKLDNQITRWSIQVKDTEFRYVDGTSLLKREKRDLSWVKIDPDLNKLSTDKLLKMFKSKRVKGNGNIRIQRILDEREHIKMNDSKIVVIG